MLILVLAVSLVVSSCTTTRVMTPGVAPASLRDEMHPGDQAKIYLKSGEVRELKITAVDTATITGEEGKGPAAQIVQIAVADVKSVVYRRFSGLRTGGLAVGVVVGVAASLLAALIIKCGSNSNKCSD